jgi:transitional endoplasmic reticulum ATPase
VPAPDEKARLKILEIKTKDMPLDDSVDLVSLVRKMAGYSGADIDSVCREAAINALRRDTEAEKVNIQDFEDALAETMPSITPDMEKWYKDMISRFKEREKPPMAIA